MKDDAYQTMDNWLTPNGIQKVEPYIGMRMKTGKKFNKLHDKIYQAYKTEREAVNDDALLFFVVWVGEGWDEHSGLLNQLRSVTRPETITRRRRELHEAGLIEYSPKAMKSRTEAFKNERDKASPIPPQAYSATNDTWDDTKPQTVSVELPKQTSLMGNIE